jgi:hypothetical protein
MRALVRRRPWIVAVALLAVVLVAGGVVVALQSGDDEPSSPPSAATSPAPSVTPGSYVPSAPGTRPLTGVYRGPGPWGAPLVVEYADFLGREPEIALDYQDVDTWENQTWPDWQASAWEALPQYQLSLGGTGIFIQGGSWAEAAQGAYDEHWRTLGERLVATGQEDAILRGAHEFNGDWFHYRVTQEEADDFVTAWRRWVDIMRSVPGQAFTFDWNPIIGTQYLIPHAEDAYPGDEYVDRIALDVYDSGNELYGEGFRPGEEQPSQEERDAAWDQILNGERGMNFWRNFAEERGKPLSFPEWGIQIMPQEGGDGRVFGGGDNASFVERMADIVFSPEWNVDYHAFWEFEAAGVADPDTDANRNGVTVSEARDAFLERFGGPAEGSSERADGAGGADGPDAAAEDAPSGG